jgi:hypothetical protein
MSALTPDFFVVICQFYGKISSVKLRVQNHLQPSGYVRFRVETFSIMRLNLYRS